MQTLHFLKLFWFSIEPSVLVIFAYMTVFFLYALYKKRNDIADIIWGPGFIAVAWTNIIVFEALQNVHAMLVASVITVWGFRLAIHIYLRNRGRDEDFRYKKWREEWGRNFALRTYFQVFLLQGLFMLLISLPMIAASLLATPAMGWITAIGFLAWLKGFGYEAIGDYQLMKFKKNPENAGKIMKTGLWKYARHPNYFGEVTQWWGIFLMVLPLPYPALIISLVGPLTITFLILKVSGIPMLEKKYDGNPEFEEYKKRTNAFFPWFPKKA